MPSLVSIQISGSHRVLVGQTLQLSLTAIYSDGTTTNVSSEAAWASSSPFTANINASGLVTALATGTSTIKATFGGFSTNSYVTIPALVSTSIVAPASAPPGQTAQFSLIQTYSDGSTQDVTSQASWFTSSAAVGTISSTGLLTCVSSGTLQVGEYQAGQPTQSVSYTVLSPTLESIAVTASATTLIAGNTLQLTATGSYSGGIQTNITANVQWTSANASATVSSTGLVTGQTAGLAILTAALSGIQAVLSLNVFAVPNPNLQPQFQSHLTQVMQNYFDYKDVRVRQGKYVLDAQLLNVAAQALEISDTRFNREIKSTTLADCPANIDSRGVYFQQALSPSFDFTASHVVQGLINSVPTTLSLYNDLLPVPASVQADPRFAPTAFTTPVVFSVSGIGLPGPGAQTWATQRVANPTLPMDSRLVLWLEGSGFNQVNVMVRITGQRAPQPAWASRQVITSETLTLTQLGASRSKFAWATITEIQVTSLPVGLTLTGQVGTFGMAVVPDAARPFTSSSARDVLFKRYWTYADGLLQEQYLASNFEGLRYIQSYATAALSGIAIEPNTYGMFVAQGTKLLYLDRREPLPASLNAPALTTEPYYGVQLSLDESQPGPLRNIVLQPVPYAQASQVSQYRYLLQTPSGSTYALTPDGVLATYTSTAGWRRGTPISLTIPLAQVGTYVITLQCAGTGNVILSDAAPYANLALAPLAQFDLSAIVPSIEGLSFDDRGRLWVWSGTYAVALELHYNAYVLDAPTQAIYLTDSVQGLIIDGVTI